MSAGAIVVFAKAPQPGRVKTRMCPPLSPEQAAALYAALLADVLQASEQIAGALDLEPVLTVHPAAAARSLAQNAPKSFRVVGQRGADLSQRMAWAVREAAAGGAARVLLRGSDSPVMDLTLVQEALIALDEADLSVSPDRDGGYSLIGLRGPVPGLFGHAMSTASVLEDTLARARAAGLRHCTLRTSFDIDTAFDLQELARARRRGETGPCPRTLAYLDAQRLWPGTETR